MSRTIKFPLAALFALAWPNVPSALSSDFTWDGVVTITTNLIVGTITSPTNQEIAINAPDGIRVLGGQIAGSAAGLSNFPASVSSTGHTHDASSIISGTLSTSRLSSVVSLLGPSIGTSEIENLAVTTSKLDLVSLDTRYVKTESDPVFKAWTNANSAIDINANDDFKANGTVSMLGNIRLSTNFLSGDGGNEGIYVSTNGNVGIGTNAPALALDVAGAGRFAGGIVFVERVGNLSMGIYTNRPSL